MDGRYAGTKWDSIRPRFALILVSCALLLIMGWSRGAWAGTTTDAGLPSGGDDTAALQALLDEGRIVSLRSGERYVISKTLDLRDGTGLITEGAPATLYMTSSAFANMDPRGETLRTRSDRVGIRAHFGVAHDLRLQNFKLEKAHVDGSYVAAIWLQGSKRVTIKDVEMSGFSLGGIVLLDSVEDLTMRGCIIRDSWAGTVSENREFRYLPQLTGISMDDNRLIENDQAVPSRHVVIANNTIRDLRFTRALYLRPRSQFIGFERSTGNVGYETDGINLQSKPVDVTISGNAISGVGEGVDTFAASARIEQNLIGDVFAYAIKLVHGASDHTVRQNVLLRTGSAAITVGGSNIPNAGNTFGNFFVENNLSQLGGCSAFAGPSVPDEFRISDSCPEDRPAGITVGALSFYQDIPHYNVFYGNLMLVQPSDSIRLQHLLRVSESVGSNYFYDTILVNTSGRVFRSFCSDAAASDLCYLVTPEAQEKTVIDSPSAPEKFVSGDFDGNGKVDQFFYWPATGLNRLYLKDNQRGFREVEEPINRLSINGYATYLTAGDFNGDGRSDLMFYWQSDGTNRLFYGTVTGGFVAAGETIPRATLSQFPAMVIAADYNGDHMDDLFFYAPVSGQNLTYFGQAIGFVPGLAAIESGAINGSPDDVVDGDFDGDGLSDLLFFWRGTGTNRFFFGAESGSYGVRNDPIAPTAVHGAAERMWVEDVNLDGRADVNFFWYPSAIRRAFLGGQDRTFSID